MIELHQGYAVTQKSPEIRIHYVEANNRPNNPLILFLHGFPECWYSWREYLQVVAKEGYHAVALDLRGYNESSRPEEVEAYGIERLVQDVREIIHYFGDKMTFVVGHDWGGLIAWELARTSPELLSGIVVMNAPYVGAAKKNLKKDISLSLKQGLRSWYVYFFQMPRIPELALRMSNFKAIEKMFFQKGHDLKLLTHHDVEIYKEALSDPRSLAAAINYYRANTNVWVKIPPGKIDVPSMLIWGEEDVALEKDLTKGMEEFFPKGISIRFYPHSSHWVHLERSREIQNEILYFFSLNRLKGAPILSAPDRNIS